MRYALLVNERVGAAEELSADERAALTLEYMEIIQDERVVGGEQLQPGTTATTVRVQDGELLLTDGPFADTKEIFGGYYLVEAPDLNGALEIAARIARIAAPRLGGSVEIRPLVER